MATISNDELARLYHLACMATYSPWDLADFDRESIDMAHKLHAVIHAQRSALIAWQFQAAGAALALQRVMDAAKHMREAQQAYEQYGSNEDSVTDAEDAFDSLLADARRVLEARNVKSA